MLFSKSRSNMSTQSTRWCTFPAELHSSLVTIATDKCYTCFFILLIFFLFKHHKRKNEGKILRWNWVRMSIPFLALLLISSVHYVSLCILHTFLNNCMNTKSSHTMNCIFTETLNSNGKSLDFSFSHYV